MRRLLRTIWHALAIVGLLALVGAVWFAAQGISARPEPGWVETTVARTARHYLIPAAERARTNPEPQTAENLRSGMVHWADHCAVCHANDGSGDVEIGRSLYPRAPDMRLPATQDLSDGTLFYIIEHGVKLTGMPAWGTGTAEGERDSWHLVQFIRRLPSLTDAELIEMDELNPRSLAEWEMLEAERRFLAGEDPPPPSDAPGREHIHKEGQP